MKSMYISYYSCNGIQRIYVAILQMLLFYNLKYQTMRQILLFLISLFFVFATLPADLTAQIRQPVQEPDLREFDEPRTPYDDGVSNGIGFNLVINNFGFGIGAEYKRVLAPFMEGTATFRITGLRDVSEQTFTDIFFGQQIVPNKYRRALSMPLTFGVRQRVFARSIADNYRIYLSGELGPVLAFSYPYFDDLNNNGYREQFQFQGGASYVEPVNDVFTGMGDGDWHLGMAGEFKLSLDIGQNFARLTSIQFGYMFYYFDEGIQMMQPNQPSFSAADPPSFEDIINGDYAMEPFFDAQRFFGTPQLSFIFGRMW
jgi:hypothetical protein